MHILLLAALLLPASPGHAPLVLRPCGAPTRLAAAVLLAPLAAVCFEPSRLSVAPVVLRVRVYNVAGARPVLAREAMEVAAGLLADHGIAPTWIFCAAGRPGRSNEPDCRLSLEEHEVIVRLSRGAAGNEPKTLGFAYVPGIVATVLVDRILETAGRTGVPGPPLIGRVIAHEVLHLVNGINHDEEGLMRAVWSDEALRSGRLSSARTISTARQPGR